LWLALMAAVAAMAGPAAAAPLGAAAVPVAPVAPASAASAAAPALPGGLLPEQVDLQADVLRAELDGVTTATGKVSLQRGPLRLDADRVDYDRNKDLVTATGQVKLNSQGNELSGSQARLKLDTQEGEVESATYRFGLTGAGGSAQRVHFVGANQISAVDATYTSCRRDDVLPPDWVLSADRLDLDLANNNGRAEGAVLRFLGVPILGAPVLSFPSTSAPRSGWLPPTIDTYDSRSGFGMLLPYYWRIAPNLDATVAPMLATRRGLGVLTEWRYLLPSDSGRFELHALPHDRTVDRSRQSFQLEHTGSTEGGLRYSADWQSASDDNYWKDFSGILPSLTPRLLAQDLRASQHYTLGSAEAELYSRVQAWQVLQSETDPIAPPYQRLPQLGLRLSGDTHVGLRYNLMVEANRFELRNLEPGDLRPNGSRRQAQADVSRPWDVGWGWLTPRLSLIAASYQTDSPMVDGRTQASRTVPTFSLDTGLRYERDATLWGDALRQTFEPRLHYVLTPRRDQSALPMFDTAASDFNEVSIYADNAFSGIDRIADAHQLTLGGTTRLLNPRSGSELLRFGMAQRVQFRDQVITALTPDATTPSSGRFSDLMLFGSATLVPRWRFDATMQYSGDTSSVTRTVLATRYQPGPFQTLSATYRFTRSLSEQVELGWQWPIYRGTQRAGSSCQGNLYGVGRVNYSTSDRRITDAIAGLEYDAGCWIGRMVFYRTSTGQTEATQKLMFQLELVGLSRLGSNPLKVLKDNIPGYQLLRDDDAVTTTTVNP
jgi:LPS-assembly protein